MANIVAITRVTDGNGDDAGMDGSELAAVAEAGGAIIVEAAGECLGAVVGDWECKWLSTLLACAHAMQVSTGATAAM